MMNSKRLAALIVWMAACAVSAGAAAAVIQVPGDYATIAEAVAAAVSGDVVEVAAGTYTVDAQISVPAGVSLVGAGAEETIVDVTGSITLFFMGDASGVTIEGFTFLLHGEGTVVSCWGTSQTVRKNIFIDAQYGVAGCGGRLENNIFAGCGTAVYAHGDSPTVVNNVFAECSMALNLHFVIRSGGQVDANPVVFNNIFIGNSEALHNHSGSPPNNYTRHPAYNVFMNNGTDCSGCDLGSPNLFEDPVFAAYTADGSFTDDDFHIVAGESPCVDSGSMSHEGAAAPDTDFDGEARPRGPNPDIGIDEVEGPPPVEEGPLEPADDAFADVLEDSRVEAAEEPAPEAAPDGGDGDGGGESGCGCFIVGGG
jgi:hypothetical protein